MAKIERKTQKIFSGLNPSKLGVFGSAQLLAPTTSTDLDTLQSAAYEQGWTDAAISGDKRPPLEEFNGIKYVNDTQTAYVLQEGIAEYDAGTTYFIGSIAKQTGTSILFKSLIDDNLGNPFVDGANWKLMGDLDDKYIYVKTQADFGTPEIAGPDIGKIILQKNTTYFCESVATEQNQILIANTLKLPDDTAAIRVTSITLGNQILVYTGVTGSLFETSPNFAGFFSVDNVFLSSPNLGTKVFDIDGQLPVGQEFFPRVYLTSMGFIDCAEIGTIKTISINFNIGGLFKVGQGFTFNSCQEVVISEVRVSAGQNIVDGATFTFTGVIPFAKITGCLFDIQSNEWALDIDPAITLTNRIILEGNQNTDKTRAFKTGSLDSTDVEIVSAGNVGIDNSNTIGAMNLLAPVTTVINTIGVPVIVNDASTGGTNIWTVNRVERFTFDSVAGSLTYIGIDDIIASFNATATISKVGGGSDTICILLATNGVGDTSTKSCTQNTTAVAVPVSGIVSLVTGDVLQMMVTNDTSTSNIIVSIANFSIISI